MKLTGTFTVNGVPFYFDYEEYASLEDAVKELGLDVVLRMVNRTVRGKAKQERFQEVYKGVNPERKR